MLYIKIMKNDTVIAVEAHPKPVYVHKQPNGTVVACSERKAQGILSVDASVIYQLEGKEPLEGTTLTAAPITTAEYLSLVESLDELPEESPEEPTEPGTEDEGEKVMTTTQMRERILDLETNLETSNEFLKDCLLEISTVIYA